MTMFRTMLLLLALGAGQAQAQESLKEDAVLAALSGFFEALSVENYPNPEISTWISDDFLIFEMGQAFSWADFQAFLADAGYDAWTSTKWTFSEARVSVSGDAAHISYTNTGEFIYTDPSAPERVLIERNIWLESAYLVSDGGRLKLKFLQSDNISRAVEPYVEDSAGP